MVTSKQIMDKLVFFFKWINWRQYKINKAEKSDKDEMREVMNK